MSSGLAAWIRRHPLPAYFILAFVGTWMFVIPLLLSQKGLGLLVLPDAAAFAFYFLAAYTGPFASAFIVTGVIDGKTGARQLLRRIVQWRVGIQWYLFVLIGYPAVFLIGLTVRTGDPWFGFKVIGLCPLLVVALTRGRLSYKPNKTAELVGTPVPQA